MSWWEMRGTLLVMLVEMWKKNKKTPALFKGHDDVHFHGFGPRMIKQVSTYHERS
jgi:hypothetical protein